MNHYLNIFFEAFHTASLVPFSSEATLAAMKAFGGFELWPAVLAGAAGGVLAQWLNWLIGHWLRARRPVGGWHMDEALLGKASAFFHRYLVWLLLGSWLTMGNVLVLVAGFLGVRLGVMLPLVAVGYVARYGWLALG
jgi:membrane protein YqaA with SNARE-associated domain